MNRKIVLLNLALLALAGALGWQARRHYLEMKAHEREILLRSAQARQVLAPPPLPQPAPVAPVQYIDVAQRTLFAKDRNPNVILDPPPLPPPEKPIPPMPTYYGQIGFVDPPVIFLTIGNAAQKRFQAGDKVGDFKLVSFDRDTITLGWNDKRVERKLDDLKSKVDQAPQGPVAGSYQAPALPSSSTGGSGGSRVKVLGGSSSDPVRADSTVGDTISGSDFRGCVMNDSTPAGAVVNGYRKVVTRTLMGNSCYWEKAK
jgi:hypothetical protein